MKVNSGDLRSVISWFRQFIEIEYTTRKGGVVMNNIILIFDKLFIYWYL